MKIGYETERIEFKKTTGELKEGVISISAMLNKHGEATLYFGIRNDGTVVGQQIGDSTLREISQAIANHIKPSVIPTISIDLLDEKNVVKIYVTGNDTPYSAFGKYYIRSADEDRELVPAQLKKYINDNLYKDKIVEIRSNKQDLSFKQLKFMFLEQGISINEKEFEENLGLKLPDGSYNLMAELLADNNDFSIKTVTFRGKDKSEIIRRNEYGFKSLVVAMDKVLSYVEALNDTKVKMGSHQRDEEKLFDFPSFKEAWQNACLHTKWEQMNPPAVYIFSDRIEIISTGGLPSGLTKGEFFRGISRPVNTKLQKIFGQLGYVEQTGHGVPLIVMHYGMQAFNISENFINVTIPFNPSFNQSGDTFSETTKENGLKISEAELFEAYAKQLAKKERLNDAQRIILKLLLQDPDFTLHELSAKSGFSVSYVRKILDALRDKKIVERVGANKNGYWKVKVEEC